MEANVDKTYVDIAEMADFLQTKFKEYSKRKRSAFRGLVKRAYTIVLNSYGADPNPDTSSDEDVEDVDDVDEEVCTFLSAITIVTDHYMLFIYVIIYIYTHK